MAWFSSRLTCGRSSGGWRSIRPCRADRANFATAGVLDALEPRVLFSTFSIVTDLTGTNGHAPQSGLIMDSSGNLYGTSVYGGTSGMGNVFEVAAGTHTLSTIASFNNTDGSSPLGPVVMDSSGDFFGATNTGGPDSLGTVYEIPAAAHAPTMLDFFTGADGALPYGNLVLDSSGNLWGTTSSGGQDSDGVIFEVPAATHKIVDIAAFNGANGATPYSGLTLDSQGNLYGATTAGGDNHFGTVFELSTTGSHTINVWASFNLATGKTNVIAPIGALILDSSGNLYGTASGGGASAVPGTINGFGTVYEVSAASPHTISVLANFGTGGNTGDAPTSGLVMDSLGNLFGATEGGTAGASTSDEPGVDGSIFEGAAGSRQLTTIYQLNDLGTEGIAPVGGLTVDASGNLFGTALAGNFAAADGTVFEISGAASSSPVTLVGGALTVNGTSGDDVISLSSDGNNITATVNGVAATPVPISSVTSISVDGNAGNDSITIESTMPATFGVSVQGGPGDDTIQGGPGNDTLGGGQGNDFILGGPGDDLIHGGAGDDSIGGGQGNDILYGGPGNDTMTGGAGNDVLIGGAGNNVLHGGLGDDTLFAINSAADTLYGGAGNDTAHIDQGLDQIPNNDIETVLFS
jgi:uncharacterized repeat protein (TIGR03803 family)